MSLDIGFTLAVDPAKVILLSFFDGIGTAPFVLSQMIGQPKLAFSWETDNECLMVSVSRVPWVMQRGDVFEEDMEALASIIRDHDPDGSCVILLTGGPPCHDFSVVKQNSEGRYGAEGSKFVGFADKLDTLEKALPGHRMAPLIENVLMNNNDDILYFSERLKAQPVLVDGADRGVVSRPRLWWSRINWSSIRADPWSGERLIWVQQNAHRRLKMTGPPLDVQRLEMRGYKLHPDVFEGRKKIPCFTTPAPDDAGRAEPGRSHGKVDPETRQRWLQGNRQFAPWQYSPHAMADKDGDLVVMPIHLKEQLHEYPVDYTQCDGVSLRARHRMLANSWHIRVTIFLLALVLQSAVSEAARVPSMTTQPRVRAIDRVLQLGTSLMAQPGPGGWKDGWAPSFVALEMTEHFHKASQAPHPALQPGLLEPGLQATIGCLTSNWPQLAFLRQAVVDEVHQLVEDFTEVTCAWLHGLHPSVHAVYTSNGHKAVTQVPVMVELLRQCGYAGVEDLSRELSSGFPLTGQLSPGTGWLPRTDSKYAFPIDMATFQSLNLQHIRERLKRPVPSPHWETMLNELLADKANGKLCGPFAAPTNWGVTCVAVSGHPLQQLQEKEVYAAVCFAVEQTGKVRRCEDFRRSYHNSLVEVADKPHHHDIQTYVDMIRHYHDLGFACPTIWGQDLDAAYRQIPVAPDAMAFTVLITPWGPTLWRHTACPFGAAASVWSFNRFADSLMVLARRLLLIPSCHFVDDFMSVDPMPGAHSSCESFKDLFRHLGLHMKPSKEQRPAHQQKVLGIEFSITDDHIVLAACETRKQKARDMILTALAQNFMSPETAQRCAGKLAFLATTFFGSSGKAALQPLYSRGHGAPAVSQDRLSTGLRRSLNLLLYLIENASPRIVPLGLKTAPTAVVYTDAFFRPGEKRTRCHTDMENGWGYVIRIGDRVLYDHGVVPAAFVRRFAPRKAFIYMLEILAVLIAVTSCIDALPPFTTFFIDNQAGKYALSKGYGRCEAINLLTSSFWILAESRGWFPHITYVQSCLNISDPVSRGDLAGAQSAGWQQHLSCPKKLYCLLTEVIDEHAGDLLYLRHRLLEAFPISTPVQGG